MKSIVWFQFIAISVLACSCTVYQHVPAPLNVPALREKNQLQVNIGGDFKKGQLQMNYAVTNSMFLFTEGFFYNSKNDGNLDILINEDKDTYKSRISELKYGFGFYHHEGTANINILLGSGIGEFDYEHNLTMASLPEYRYRVQGRTLDLYFQPSFGFQPSSWFEMLFSVRVKHYTYFHIHQEFENDTEHYGDKCDYIFDRPITGFNYVEPAFTMRAGSENVKFQMQIYRSYCLERNSPKQKEVSMNFQIGTVFNFGGNKEKKADQL